jgi:phage shock protein PspC (stress-responsive transcriptional regulator)
MINKKLYRSREDYIVAGVAGGLAQYLEIDPTIVRLVFVALALGGGSGVLIYIVLALVIPREPGEPKQISRSAKIRETAADVGQRTKTLVEEFKEDKEIAREGGRAGSALGISLIILGGLLLVNKLIPIQLAGDWFWPVVLVGLGTYLLVK